MPPKPSKTPLLGAHVSVAGGLEKAFPRAEALGCTAIQIFVKNANQWQARPLTDDRIEAFRAARRASRVQGVVAHASYLINLASRDEPTYGRSLDALTDELDRCHRLGVDGLVLHPGAHRGHGVDEGVRRVAEALDRVFDRFERLDTRLLLENTAGQGTYLGSRHEELAAIRGATAAKRHVGFCLDTCHAFAAGADLRRAAGLAGWLQDVQDTLGLGHVRCLHMNDSLGACGSNRDRHANLGCGEIGMSAFASLVRAPQLQKVPKILETPTGDDARLHRVDLDKLRAAARRSVRAEPLRAKPRRRVRARRR